MAVVKLNILARYETEKPVLNFSYRSLFGIPQILAG